MQRLLARIACYFKRHVEVLIAQDVYQSFDELVPVRWYRCIHCSKVRRHFAWDERRFVWEKQRKDKSHVRRKKEEWLPKSILNRLHQSPEV